MDSFGGRLRHERERRQIALKSIAESTKISVPLLEGLERDDVSRWPSGIFRKSFVRAYAEAIGLDPEPVVREFVELYPDPLEVEIAAPPPPATVVRARSPHTSLLPSSAGPLSIKLTITWSGSVHHTIGRLADWKIVRMLLSRTRIILSISPICNFFNRAFHCCIRLAHVNARPQLRIRLRLPEHFAGHGRGVPFAERQKLQQVRDRIAFGPAEVRVRNLARLIADEQQQGGDGVGDRGARAPQHAMPADVGALTFETSLNTEASDGCTSTNSTCSSGGRWCDSCASRSLRVYSSGSPVSGRFAMMRIGALRRLAKELFGHRSAATPCTRSSVDRSTREMSDVHDDRDDEE